MPPAIAAPSLRLCITTAMAKSPSTSPLGYDKKLVYEPYFQRRNERGEEVVETITGSSGLWWLIDMPTGEQHTMQDVRKNLLAWVEDSTFGSKLKTGKIVSVELGLGDYNANTLGLVTQISGSYTAGGKQATFNTTFRDAASAKKGGWTIGSISTANTVDFTGARDPIHALRLKTVKDSDVGILERKGDYGTIAGFSASYTWVVP